MLVSGNKQDDTRSIRAEAHPPIHGERPGNHFIESASDSICGQVQIGGLKFKPQKKLTSLCVSGVLVKLRDIGSVMEQKAGHRRNNPGAIRAGNQQASGIFRTDRHGAGI